MPIRAVLLDMDGVLYRGRELIPEALVFIRGLGNLPFMCVTNNSSLTPEAIGAKLQSLGYSDVGNDRILTSAQATAAFLHAERPGFRYFAVGGEGLHQALRPVGQHDTEQPDFVVIGEGPGLDYASMSIGIDRLVNRGARLVGTNPDNAVDGTLNGQPAVLPGGGALAAPFAVAAGVEPLFIGKPEPWLYREALRRLDCEPTEAVMIGDRPDTDIAGAARLGLRTVLVRTGRFPVGADYPDEFPRPDFDVRSLADLDWSQVTA